MSKARKSFEMLAGRGSRRGPYNVYDAAVEQILRDTNTDSPPSENQVLSGRQLQRPSSISKSRLAPILAVAAGFVLVIVSIGIAGFVNRQPGNNETGIAGTNPEVVAPQTPGVDDSTSLDTGTGVDSGPFSDASSLAWSEIEISPDAGTVENIVYFQDRFVAFTASGRLFRSDVGEEWSEIQSDIPPLFDPQMFASESMAVLGGRADRGYQVWGSTDGSSWHLLDLPEPEFGSVAAPDGEDGFDPYWLLGMAEYNGTLVLGINYTSPGGAASTAGPYVSRFWIGDGEKWEIGEEPLGGESTYALSINAIPTGIVSVAVQSSHDTDLPEWKTFLSTDGIDWQEMNIAVPAVNNAPLDETIATTPNGLLMATQFLMDSNSELAMELGDVAIWVSPDGVDWAPTSIVNVEFWPRMVFGGELGAIAAIADMSGNAKILFSKDLTSWSIENLEPVTSGGVTRPASGAIGSSSALLSFAAPSPVADTDAATVWIGQPLEVAAGPDGGQVSPPTTVPAGQRESYHMRIAVLDGIASVDGDGVNSEVSTRAEAAIDARCITSGEAPALLDETEPAYQTANRILSSITCDVSTMAVTIDEDGNASGVIGVLNASSVSKIQQAVGEGIIVEIDHADQ